MSILKNTSEHRCSCCRKQGGEAKKWKIYNLSDSSDTRALHVLPLYFISVHHLRENRVDAFWTPPSCPRHLGWPSSMQAAGFIVNYAQRCLHCRNTRAAAAAHPRHRMQEDAAKMCKISSVTA